MQFQVGLVWGSDHLNAAQAGSALSSARRHAVHDRELDCVASLSSTLTGLGAARIARERGRGVLARHTEARMRMASRA